MTTTAEVPLQEPRIDVARVSRRFARAIPLGASVRNGVVAGCAPKFVNEGFPGS